MEDGREEDSSKQTVPNSKHVNDRARRIVGRVIEVAIVAVVIAAVWGLFSLPSVFFFMDMEGNSTSSSPTCTPEVYTGQFCRDALLSRQLCIPGRENTIEIYIQSEFLGGLFQDQTQIEMLLGNFQSFIQFEPSPECLEMLIPFLCSYIFAPCSDTGQLHLPLEKECINLRDDICMQEWNEITNLQQGLSFLPNCETLPGPSMSLLCHNVQTAIPSTQNTSSGITATAPNTQNSSAVLNITCSMHFYLDIDAGYCKPACGQWKPFPDDVVLASSVIVIIAAVVGLVSGISILTISILKYRQMFKFPSILILYQSINFMIFLFTILLGYMDTEKFLCSSQDATESLTGTTPYCTFHGIAIFYLLNQAMIFWAAHIATILWLIAFPFKAKHLEASGKMKIIHILVLATALVLPIVSAAVAMGTGGFRPFYYPDICVAMNIDVAYYALILPLSIMTALGITFLILLFWVLIRRKLNDILTALSKKVMKKRNTKRADLINSTIPTTALLKVIASFLCFAIIPVIGIAASASLFRSQSLYAEELTEYFICESSGISSDKVCERTYESLHNPLPTAVSTLFFGVLWPGVNLLYIINLRELWLSVKKKLLTRPRSTRAHRITNTESTDNYYKL